MIEMRNPPWLDPEFAGSKPSTGNMLFGFFLHVESNCIFAHSSGVKDTFSIAVVRNLNSDLKHCYLIEG